MELEQFSELYQRIRTEPSILLLGQGYLCLENGVDPIWLELTKEYADSGLSPKKVDYPDLWNATVKQENDARRLLAKIHTAADLIEPQPNLRVMLDLHWSLLYTSAIDKGLMSAAGEGFGINDEPSREREANRRFMNKSRRYCVNICDSDDGLILLDTKVKKHRFERSIAQKLDWISNTYLRDYGVLVIDGYDPEHDWLTDELLFGEMDGMPYKSIYWFSAPQELPNFAQELETQGVLTVDEKSFISHLHQHMPELFETEEEDDQDLDSHMDPTLYTSLTLHSKYHRDRTIYIPRAKISEINGSSLCLLDDEILADRPVKFDDRALAFAQFLTQKNLPSWDLFRSEPHKPGFYFAREQDSKLLTAVQNQLAIQDGSHRRPLLLEGPSNSGKTAMLANLALKLAAQRKYPVLFLHGDLLPGAEARLQKFLKDWFMQEAAFGGERVERVLIVWDGNSVQNDWRRYYNLQKQLFTSNVLVVGSCYTTDRQNTNSIRLPQELDHHEMQRLKNVIKSLGGEFYERFNAIQNSTTRPIGMQCGQNSLLYILQTLFRYEFDEEYREVSHLLKLQFGQERIFAENRAADSLQQYVEEFNRTVDAVAQHGSAASYQMKLQLYLKKHFPEAAEKHLEAQNSLPENERRHIRMQEAIQRMNRALALAGEFGVLLPSSLLLHLLKDEDGKSYVCYGQDTAKLFEVLQNDSLIEEVNISTNYFGDEQFYRFRNSLEAENYICLLDNLPIGESSPQRLEREYKILMELMESADGDEDLIAIIELIRQFGPNGHGKLSEQSRSIMPGNYHCYQNYWELIAERLIELFGDDPEAVLVYAHLMREANNLQEKAHPEAYTTEFNDLYGAVRVRLENAIQKLEQSGELRSPRWCRLNIERCANLQQSMRHGNFNFVNYQSIVETIQRVFSVKKNIKGTEQSRGYEFSSNYMLDILLNAFISYIQDFNCRLGCTEPQKCMENQEFRDQLVARIQDIDKMPSLDDMIQESNSANSLSKIAKVYDYLNTSESLRDKLENSFQNRNNDTYIYMQARCLWQDSFVPFSGTLKPKEMLKRDRYLLLCNHDIPYMELGDLTEIITNTALKDAQKVITYLQSKISQIKAAHSERCLMMLIRAQWLQLSHNSMLAQKQRIPFTKSEWNELINLCRTFVSFHEIMNQESFPPAYFLLGINEWIYGDPAKAKEFFRTAQSDIYGDYATIERMILCKWGSREERTFKVRIKRNDNGRWTATVIQETTSDADNQDWIIGRYNVAVPKNLREYILRDAPLYVKEFNPRTEFTIRFNLSGPQLGLRLEGEGD